MLDPATMPGTPGPQMDDAADKPLRWYLEGALNRMTADRVLSPDEQRDIGWFFQSLRLFVAQQQANGVQSAAQMGQQQFQPQPGVGGGPVEDYGAGAGTPIEYE